MASQMRSAIAGMLPRFRSVSGDCGKNRADVSTGHRIVKAAQEGREWDPAADESKQLESADESEEENRRGAVVWSNRHRRRVVINPGSRTTCFSTEHHSGKVEDKWTEATMRSGIVLGSFHRCL
eukprot:2531990-Rhodomonas_salina.3